MEMKQADIEEVVARRGKLASPTFLHRGMLVSFRNLTYNVRNSTNRKEMITLLHGVSGYLRAGELVALMGPSGCGKTTLMDILAGRKTVGVQTGELLYDGVKPSRPFLRRFTGYVEQFDSLVPILTVEEMFMYTADLKLETSTSKEDKARAVETVIDMLALDTCRGTLIGSPLERGISGGQTKRVNIGIALISNPQILFLDEPTTGLDSFTANEVMSVIKSLAAAGITVCATIHSPTPYAFKLFDRLLLLLGGKVTYFGRNGSQAIDFLRESAHAVATTVDLDPHSPAEWITDVTVVADRSGGADQLAAAYEASNLKQHAEEELAVQLKARSTLPDEVVAALTVRRETSTSTVHALGVLMRYRMLRNYQSAAFYGAHVGPWLIQTIIIFSVFWMVAKDLTQASVTNVAAIIFFWSICPVFGAASYIPSIMLARPLYFRERNDGLYRPITFLLYLLLEEFIVAVPVTLSVCTVMWFGLGLAGSWFMWWVSFAITYISGIAMSYAICSYSPNIDVANAAVPVYGVSCMFFSGFLIAVKDMGWWWRWYVYLNPTYYAVGSQLSNFFSGDRDIVFVNDLTVTEYYNVNYLPAWGFVGMQLIFPVVFITLAWTGLAFKTTIQR